MHEHEEGVVRKYTYKDKQYMCLILRKWHLLYKGVYPTYKVELLDDEIPEDLVRILIVPQTSLSY